MWLVLVNIITIDPCELLEYISLVLPAHIFSVGPLFYLVIDLTVQLFFHVFRHVLVFFKLAHSVDVIIFLIKLKWVKSMLSLVLHVDISGTLLLSYLFLSLLKFFVN